MHPFHGSPTLPTAEPRLTIPDEPLDESAVRIPYEEFETLPERPQRKFSDRPIQIGTRMGFGTTVGLIGLLGEYNVDDMLALGGGIGVNGWGPIWGIHARIRPLIGDGAVFAWSNLRAPLEVTSQGLVLASFPLSSGQTEDLFYARFRF